MRRSAGGIDKADAARSEPSPLGDATTSLCPALFQRGDFTLASGAKAKWKIECDALTDDDWDGLAAMLADYLPVRFYDVRGVPRGGLPLERALRPYVDSDGDHLLVVDDVWTTGGSMQRFIDVHVQRLETHPLHRAVIFARNPAPDGVTALFSVPSLSADQADQRECSNGPDFAIGGERR